MYFVAESVMDSGTHFILLFWWKGKEEYGKMTTIQFAERIFLVEENQPQ